MKTRAGLCRCCHRQLSEKPIIKYMNMPKSAQFFPDINNVEDEKGVDILLYECPYCGLIQAAGEPVPYYRDVIRATGVSAKMREFRIRQYRDWIKENDLQDKKILEVGCGKGEYMDFMEAAGGNVTGIEHLQESVAYGQSKGHRIYRQFIEDHNTVIEGGPYDAFYIMNFLEHIPDPGEFIQGIAANLTDNGVGIVEVPNIDMILAQSLYSEFIQDHLSYFTSSSLRNILELNGFEVLECKSIWYDYILSATVRRRKKMDTSKFAERMASMKKETDMFLDMMEAKGYRTAVWGAGHQALANLSLLNMDDRITCVIDSAEFKQNKYTPATHLPIYGPDYLDNGIIKAVLIMAAGYSDEIKQIIQNKYPHMAIAIMREDRIEVISQG